MMTTQVLIADTKNDLELLPYFCCAMDYVSNTMLTEFNAGCIDGTNEPGSTSQTVDYLTEGKRANFNLIRLIILNLI